MTISITTLNCNAKHNVIQYNNTQNEMLGITSFSFTTGKHNDNDDTQIAMLSITSFSIMTFSIMTLRMTMHRITAFSVAALTMVTLRHNENQHNVILDDNTNTESSVFMLSVVILVPFFLLSVLSIM
jgi:hypothetical protein